MGKPLSARGSQERPVEIRLQLVPKEAYGIEKLERSADVLEQSPCDLCDIDMRVRQSQK